MKKLLTVQEAARKLNCSDQAVRNMLHEGILHRVKNVPGIRISQEEIENLVHPKMVTVIEYVPVTIEEYDAVVRQRDALKEMLRRIGRIVAEGR